MSEEMIRGLAIDPGSTRSPLVSFTVERDIPKNGLRPAWMIAPPWGIVPKTAREDDNERICNLIESFFNLAASQAVLVIEIAPAVFPRDGKRQGGAKQLFEAERWGGQFIRAFRQAGGISIIKCYRSSARAAVLDRSKGDDTEVRRALIEYYGGKDRAFGKKCKSCGGKGWKGRGRPPCMACDGSGWEHQPGPLHGWTGSHKFAALACAFAAFQPGGLYDQLEDGR